MGCWTMHQLTQLCPCRRRRRYFLAPFLAAKYKRAPSCACALCCCACCAAPRDANSPSATMLSIACPQANCPFRTSKDSYLQNHSREHEGRVVFYCSSERCGACYMSNRALGTHTKSVHTGADASFVCDVPLCEYRGHSASLLLLHQRRHAKDFKHKCSHCDFPFVSRSELTVHASRRHSDLPLPNKTFRDGKKGQF